MAAAGFMNAAAALLATNPAIHPLALSDASGRRTGRGSPLHRR
jgi:hypothetical protein